MGVIYLCIPIGAALMIVESLAVARRLLRRGAPAPPADPPTGLIVAMTLFLFGLFFVLLLLELPVAFAIGVSSSVAVLFSERLPPTFIVSKIFAGLDSFPLMAIPFYVLAGNLMSEGGLTQKIVSFANALVGHVRGGLAHVSIVSARDLLRGVGLGGRRHRRHRVDHDPGHEEGGLRLRLRGVRGGVGLHDGPDHSAQHPVHRLRLAGPGVGGPALPGRFPARA